MPANPSVFEVQRILHAGLTLSQQDIDVAERALSSSDIQHKILGAEILVRVDCSESLKDQVAQVLEDLCFEAGRRGIPFLKDLLVVLLEMGTSFIERDSVRNFIYKAAESDEVGCRLNATLVLGRLVRRGDAEATRLLAIRAHDSDEMVRTNAAFSLRGA